MEPLTFDRAVELAKEVVIEFGAGYVYPSSHRIVQNGTSTPSCVYVHEGKPSCLVGQILHKHGVPVEELAQHEFQGAWTVSGILADADYPAQFFLDTAQAKQDQGTSWGLAVNSAVEEVKAYL